MRDLCVEAELHHVPSCITYFYPVFPVTPWQTQVVLPEEPPDVTEPVAAALLQLLRILIADSSQ
ncbi:hypothetical protein [Streptomyces sp. NPDC056683]|uniref:hypothetical protein n=1 Tax=Streptomyces sp. NPDC056683 TaxID=3345910 RepID=UPI00367990B3